MWSRGARFVFMVAATASGALGLASCVGDDPAPVSPSSDDATSSETSTATDATTADGGGGDDATVALSPLDDAVSVAAGRSHSCALTAGQDVLCWGANGSGQLGVPVASVPRSSRPVKVDLGGKATAIATGANHSCAILTDGKIKCWGNNERGQLGRGNLLTTGSVDLVSPPPTNPTLWTSAEVITAGASFTCAGMNDGSASGLPFRRFFCWGENINRQAGTESTNGQPATLPSLVTQTGNDVANPALNGFTVSCGDDFACAGVYGAAGAATFSAAGCWGSRAVGQIGAPPITNGFEVNPRFPSRLGDGGVSPIFGLFKTGLVATGAQHGCVRFEQAGVSPISLDCWGNNTHGQLASPLGGFHPAERVAGFDATNVTALAAGGQTTCVINGGAAQCVGRNHVGQLGRGTADAQSHDAFVSVVDLPPSASAIAVGTAHVCAVLGTAAGQKGQVACWGQNDSGQLGDGLDVDTGYVGAPAGLERARAAPVRVVTAR